METDQVNVAELCAGLYEGFQPIEQDTVVTIECQGQKFLCHRDVLATKSAYFERMFNNDVWIENVTGSVVLAGDHMNRATVLEVLKYMYAGKATITSSIFINMLYVGNYLDVPGLEAHCVRMMLQDRPEPIADLLEVLLFAHSVNNESLINVLASCNMTESLKKFFRTDEFLDISAHLLSIIVSKLWKAPPIMNEVLRRAINRWELHAPGERAEHALRLYKVLEPPSKSSLGNSIGSSHSLLEVRPDIDETFAARPNPSFYVYALDTEDRMKMYRFDGMNMEFKEFRLERSSVQGSKFRGTRFVSVDNVGVFGMGNDVTKCFHPTFVQYASTNIFEQRLALERPPIYLFPNFDLCNLSNRGLYLLPHLSLRSLPVYRSPGYDESKQEFSNDEIQRGIYFYNIELDRWFPVPAMKRHPFESCMSVEDNNMVYVIGSRDYKKFVQAYDVRERQWYRKPDVLNIHTDAQSCVVDGKIYVTSERCCERYDPIADRWEDVSGFRNYYHKIQRLVSYKNQLWQFRKPYFNFCRDFQEFMDVYDPRTGLWDTVSSSLTFETMALDLNEYDVQVDAVVW